MPVSGRGHPGLSQARGVWSAMQW